MPYIPIRDAGDPRLSAFLGLRDGDRRFRRPAPAGRRDEEVFAAEGGLVTRRALAAGHALRAVLVDERRLGDVPRDLPADVPVYVTSPAVARDVTGLGVVREMIGLFARPAPRTVEEVVTGAARLLVLEAVVNPVNLGTLVRTAAALGVDGTLLGPGSVDPLYRRALRTSMGATLTHPTASTGPLAEALAELRARGIRVLALTPSPDAPAIEEEMGDALGPVALVLGSEGPGLTPEALAAADAAVRIPMHAGIDSLNVATAAAIALYLLTRGRAGG
jgi:tRNA G18 (ribose-2'-O)-methylase SpoU